MNKESVLQRLGIDADLLVSLSERGQMCFSIPPTFLIGETFILGNEAKSLYFRDLNITQNIFETALKYVKLCAFLDIVLYEKDMLDIPYDTKVGVERVEAILELWQEEHSFIVIESIMQGISSGITNSFVYNLEFEKCIALEVLDTFSIGAVNIKAHNSVIKTMRIQNTGVIQDKEEEMRVNINHSSFNLNITKEEGALFRDEPEIDVINSQLNITYDNTLNGCSP